MNWPRGKNNGCKVVGFKLKLNVDILSWRFFLKFSPYLKTIQIGPVHVWFECNYQ